MNFGSSILLFEPSAHQASDSTVRLGRATELGSQGFSVRCCSDVTQLHQQLQRKTDAEVPAFAVLNGSHNANCTAATYLRMFQPKIGIVALVDSFNEAALIQTLQSGADSYCPHHASTALLIVTLFRLQKRTEVECASVAPAIPVPGPVSADSGQWVLRDQAWVLANPAGMTVSLTTSERAFMLTLFNAPEMRARHADLIAAVNGGSVSDATTAAQSRLGVLVSRMRRKFRQQGIKLPLKSVHNWGYMFTEADWA
jgi:DNA-binding response OmpR family regulator